MTVTPSVGFGDPAAPILTERRGAWYLAWVDGSGECREERIQATDADALLRGAAEAFLARTGRRLMARDLSIYTEDRGDD